MATWGIGDRGEGGGSGYRTAAGGHKPRDADPLVFIIYGPECGSGLAVYGVLVLRAAAKEKKQFAKNRLSPFTVCIDLLHRNELPDQED